MADRTDIRDRIERAQSTAMSHEVVDTNPAVVQVHSEASDRIHTVVPNICHCSCEDNTYRDVIVCKHLIWLHQNGYASVIDSAIMDQWQDAWDTLQDVQDTVSACAATYEELVGDATPVQQQTGELNIDANELVADNDDVALLTRDYADASHWLISRCNEVSRRDYANASHWLISRRNEVSRRDVVAPNGGGSA